MTVFLFPLLFGARRTLIIHRLFRMFCVRIPSPFLHRRHDGLPIFVRIKPLFLMPQSEHRFDLHLIGLRPSAKSGERLQNVSAEPTDEFLLIFFTNFRSAD